MVVTGFHPEPNYILASTASIAFLISAATSHWLIAWHHQVPLSFALVLSSIWFHTQRTYMAYIADQCMIVLWILGAMYEAYMRGPISMSLAFIGIAYNVLVFYVGYIGKCFAFDERRHVSTFFHMTTHMVGLFSIVGVLLCMPPCTLDTIDAPNNCPGDSKTE
jgi:hypothetical protein